MSATAIAPGPHRPSLARRIYGLGSVFGKTLRDSRRALLLVGGILAIILIAVSQAIVREFATPESREGLAAVIAAVPPILPPVAHPRCDKADRTRTLRSRRQQQARHRPAPAG